MLVGKGISEGIGLGKAVILEENGLKIEKQKIEDISAEKQQIYDAVKEVESEIEKLIKNIDGTEKEIMQAYLMILQDPSLIQETIKIIEQEKCNSAYAVENGLNQIIKTFEEMDDPYMAARSRDIEDMKKRILAKLLKIEEIDLSKLPENTILVAKELSTSDTAKMNLKNISGIITEIGGVNSHMAIIARTNEIPAVVGIKHIFENIKENDYIALNGATGEIFLNPTQEKIKELTKNQENIKQEKQELEKYKNKKAITKDGHQVELLANIGGPQDIQIVIDNTAEGVGLLRSEFLYMDAKDFPSEEEQFEAYKKIAESLENKRLVIRTLDIGGDKDLKYMKLPKEENPFLGYRAIRIYLDNVDLFKVQLRAILRASSYGNVAIMLPMISSIEELRKSKEIIEEVKQELKEKNIKFNENIEVGIMIEIPSSAVMADEFAKECDFFSIGTNDLIQYTIAVERGNEKLANLYSHFNPAVIRLIKSAIDGAHKNGILCGMCGEAAGDVKFIPLLVGLGLDEFSMNANKILKARKLITDLSFEECKELTNKVLELESTEGVKRILDTK
ncbi:phosphoenolpyruvate-protein phosphotransferase [Clostridium sp. CAG:470]|nr:MAG: phosphoenolpyruvate--protein phosphotransferase [Clostridium sp. 28_17]CDE15074.1 phosphoenolpyruvate-protein phosphotransferase [Clostridium sp. CAG:470]